MDQDEGERSWAVDAAVYTITRLFADSMAKRLPALRDVEGVEAWVELHLLRVQGSIDVAKEAFIWTREGDAYPVCIEGTAFVSPTFESVEAGIWQPGDWLVTVSGIACERLQAGDLLVQEKNANKRAERKQKRPPS
jgi:hypothetical protein